jgi:hypothetical protein
MASRSPETIRTNVRIEKTLLVSVGGGGTGVVLSRSRKVVNDDRRLTARQPAS